MTKPITSVMALILIEQGKLRLYDMLPQFDKRFAQMTVLSPQRASRRRTVRSPSKI